MADGGEHGTSCTDPQCRIPGCRDPRWHAGMRRDQLGPIDPGKDHRLGVYCVPDGYFPPGIAASLCLSIAVKLSNEQPDGPNIDYTDAFIRLEYGTGDGADEGIVDVDPMDGTCVSLPARSVIAKLIYPINNPDNLIVQPTLDISISVALGAASASGERPTRKTQKVGTITVNAGPVESAKFPIPPFSHGAVLQTNDATVSGTIKWYMSTDNAALAIAQNVIGKLDRDSVPVPDGARAFSITAAATMTRTAVVFFVCPG